MSQYKPNPFVEALNVIAPILAPSFELVSLRDDNNQRYSNPVISYVIASIVNKERLTQLNKFRTTYAIILDLGIRESLKPIDWCEYEELKDAQDMQALLYKMEVILQDIIVMLVNPSKFSKDLSNGDTIYSKYEFRFEGFRDGVYYRKKGKQDMTGVAIEFNLSFLSDENTTCCVDDNSKDIAEKLQALVEENTISYKLLQKRIDS